jgi:O-antigen ligase
MDDRSRGAREQVAAARSRIGRPAVRAGRTGAPSSSLGRRVGGGLAALAKLCEFLLLPAAYMVVFGYILLSNDIEIPRFTYVAVVMPLAATVALPFAWRVLTTSRLFWAVFAYLLAIGIASVLLPDISDRIFNRHLRMSPMILYFLIVTAFLTARSRPALVRLMLGCVVTVAVSAAINMVSFVGSHPFSVASLRDYRLMATLGMPEYGNATNISITYAVYCIAGLAMMTDDDLRWRRILFAAGAAVLFVAVLMTQARSAYGAIGLSVMVLAGSQSRATRVALIIGVVLTAALLLFTPYVDKAMLARGFSYRPELWADYLTMSLKGPMFGYGITPDIDQSMNDGRIVDQPHNIVLSALVRGGVIGALAMVTVLLGGIYWTFRRWRSAGQITPLCLMVAMTTASMFDYQLLATNPTWPYVTFWLPIGIAIGAEVVERAAGAQRPDGTPRGVIAKLAAFK